MLNFVKQPGLTFPVIVRRQNARPSESEAKLESDLAVITGGTAAGIGSESSGQGPALAEVRRGKVSAGCRVIYMVYGVDRYPAKSQIIFQAARSTDWPAAAWLTTRRTTAASANAST